MTVVSHKLSHRGSPGSIATGSKLTAQSVYRVTTDDPLDNVQTIINYFDTQPSLPTLGSPYQYGNDTWLLSYCTQITPTKTQGSPYEWDVICTFEPFDPNDPNQGEDQDGNPTDDPLAFRTEISFGHASFTIPAERALFMGAVGKDDLPIPVQPRPTLNWEAPRNSAGVPFDPPLEKEVSRLTLRVSVNKAQFPDEDITTYQNKVNDDLWEWSAPHLGIVSWDILDYTIRMVQIGGAWMKTNDVDHWRVDYEMLIDPDTWVQRVLDRGFAARANDGDDDGNGGQISENDILSGMPPHRAVVDINGASMPEPVMFDGAGKPLKPANVDDAVYLKYLVYEQAAFKPLFDTF